MHLAVAWTRGLLLGTSLLPLPGLGLPELPGVPTAVALDSVVTLSTCLPSFSWSHSHSQATAWAWLKGLGW